jgi:hypothetical protein
MALEFLLDRFDELPATRALIEQLPGPGRHVALSGLPGSSPALLVATLARRLPQRMFAVLTPTPADAERWLADLRVLHGGGVGLFPQRESLGAEEPHIEIAGERVETIDALLSGAVRVAVTTAPVAPSGPNRPAGVASKDSKFEKALREFQGRLSVPPTRLPEAGAVSPKGIAYTCTPEMQAELGRALYEDYAESLTHNRDVFLWQLRSGQIIFWVILLLVFVGILFSGLQFGKSFLLLRAGSGAKPEEMHTELELSTKGVKISSSVLGVVILVTSLAFLYLYLVHVYPIEYVRTTSVQTAADANAER